MVGIGGNNLKRPDFPIGPFARTDMLDLLDKTIQDNSLIAAFAFVGGASPMARLNREDAE